MVQGRICPEFSQRIEKGKKRTAEYQTLRQAQEPYPEPVEGFDVPGFLEDKRLF